MNSDSAEALRTLIAGSQLDVRQTGEAMDGYFVLLSDHTRALECLLRPWIRREMEQTLHVVAGAPQGGIHRMVPISFWTGPRHLDTSWGLLDRRRTLITI